MGTGLEQHVAAGTLDEEGAGHWDVTDLKEPGACREGGVALAEQSEERQPRRRDVAADRPQEAATAVG
jgi:hypothetical protein